jgi:cell division protein FtsI (penicillin-binding protein 3)
MWVLLSIALLALVARLLDLAIFQRDFLLKQSKARILRKVTIPTNRGMISDRLGSPLAVSIPVASVWVNPKGFVATHQQARQLARILGISERSIAQNTKNKRREFAYLKRGVPVTQAEAVKALGISGLYLQREYRRYYPEASVTAHLIGFTNIDDQGQEGMELAYEPWLHGVAGQKEVIKDRLGNVITELSVIKRPEQGKELRLSVDHRIQYLVYHELQEAVENFHAVSGSAVVLDVQTGEVLAMVNQPSFNPNHRANSPLAARRNRAATDMFEPGSVIKPFTVAFALQSGRYKPNSKIDTQHGAMMVGGYRITDDLDFGVVTLTELLQKSSNIAAAKILLSLDARQYWRLLSQLGFGQRSDSGFPGEADGRISPEQSWVPSVIATLAYGYGLSVTPLQLAGAYSVIAAGGVKRPISLLKTNGAVKGERILSEKVTRDLAVMLEAVVQDGTGTRAQIPGYRVAGKTGTAYLADSHGYDRHRYMSTFVGFAPASHPRLVIAVTIKEPKGQHFAAQVAAPVFARMMSGSLRLLDISPDA